QNARNILDQAFSEKSIAEGHLAAVSDRRHASYEAHVRETDLLTEAFRSWMNTLAELQLGFADDIIELVRDWCARAEGSNPLRSQAEEAFAEVTRRLSESTEAVKNVLSNESAAIAVLEAEQRALLDGTHTAPPAPYTRA